MAEKEVNQAIAVRRPFVKHQSVKDAYNLLIASIRQLEMWFLGG